jgi:hypothetical protein
MLIPGLFSGMEALLVPETVGLKAEVAIVRGVAVHAAVGHPDFDPGQIMGAYTLRSDLIHGHSIPDVLDEDAATFADFRRIWALPIPRWRDRDSHGPPATPSSQAIGLRIFGSNSTDLLPPPTPPA